MDWTEHLNDAERAELARLAAARQRARDRYNAVKKRLQNKVYQRRVRRRRGQKQRPDVAAE